MVVGSDGTTYNSSRAVTAYGPAAVACPGNGATTTIVNWVDAQVGGAGMGAVLRIENQGPDQLDSMTYRGAYNPGGLYNETVDAVPLPVGKAREIAIQDVNVNIPPPFVFGSVTIAGANGANVVVRIVRRDF